MQFVSINGNNERCEENSPVLYSFFDDQTERSVTVIARGIFHSSFMINGKRSN